MSKQSVREFLDEMEKVFEEVDYSDSIYEQQKASQDFSSGQLIVAKDCSFSLNDFETKLNNNVLIVAEAERVRPSISSSQICVRQSAVMLSATRRDSCTRHGAAT